MYLANSSLLPGSMNNLTDGSYNLSLLSHVPKRIPADRAEWFKTFGNSYDFPEHSRDMTQVYSDADFYFYVVVSILTLVFIVGLIILYSFCCIWAMRGNLDLPQPGGGMPPPSNVRITLKNPFSSFLMRFNRYDIDKDANPNYPDHRPTHNTLNKSEGIGIATISNSQPEPRRSKPFESKAVDLCDGFKQFKQFKYDIQDDEPEDIVFDVFDHKN